MPSPITDFYDPAICGKDPKRRTLDNILSRPDSWLEYSHDYIQILFPLPEPSPFNYLAPIVDSATFEAFRARPELRTRLKGSFLRILRFFGFILAGDDDIQVVPAPDFVSAPRSWFRPIDHNHLRITRVIRSLRVLGLEDEALAFFVALKALAEKYTGRISRSSVMYWERAASRPLFARPEDRGIDEASGLDFLVEFERKRDEKVSSTNKSRREGNNKAVSIRTPSSYFTKRIEKPLTNPLLQPFNTNDTTKDRQQQPEPATLPTKNVIPGQAVTSGMLSQPEPPFTGEPTTPTRAKRKLGDMEASQAVDYTSYPPL